MRKIIYEPPGTGKTYYLMNELGYKKIKEWARKKNLESIK